MSKSFDETCYKLDTGIVENNYLDLAIKPSELVWQANNRWKYFGGGWQYPGKLTEEEWNEARQAFIDAGDHVQIDKKADIIKNLADVYTVWLGFTGADSAHYKIDVPIWKKNFKGSSNGDRRIDPRCPTVNDTRKKIIDRAITPEETLILEDILNSRPDFAHVDTIEEKLQYKLNGSVVETAFKYALRKLNIPFKELDTYGDYIYKGSPGDLADFDIGLDRIVYRVDTKLIKSTDTSGVKKLAHDADILITYSIDAQDVIVDIMNSKFDYVVETEKFKELVQTLKDEMNSYDKPFIRIKSINTLTGEVEYSLTKDFKS